MHLIYYRKLFETVGGRKHKLLFSQKFKIKKSKYNLIKPIFINVPKDFLNNKRAKIVKYINFDEINEKERSRIDTIKQEMSDFEEDTESDNSLHQFENIKKE